MMYTYKTAVVIPIGKITTWATTFTFPIKVTTIKEEWVVPPLPYWLFGLAIAGFLIALIGVILYGRREEGYV